MASSWVFDTLILRYFNLHYALQCLISVVRLARFNCYYRYRVLKVVDHLYLSQFLRTYEVHPGHALVNFVSPVKASSESLNIYLALVSATLFEVGQQGKFSYHIVYTRLMAHLASAHWAVLFYKVYSKSLAFWRKIEDSAPFFRFPLSVFNLQRFQEEAPKLPADFLSLSILRKLLGFLFCLIH